MSEPRKDEIVIEYNRSGNRNTYFPPCNGPTRVYGSQEVIGVRSTIIPMRSGDRPPSTFTSIQQIPGQRVHVDVKGRKARITDALNDKANAGILAQVKTAINSDTRHFWPLVDGGEPDMEYEFLTEEDVHNWLFWMARHVEDGLAMVAQGKDQLPSVKALRNAGDIKAPLAPGAVLRYEFGGSYLPKTEDAAQLMGAK